MGLLRLLLALSVVLFHSRPFLGIELLGGVRAVQSFYVISGFYMALVLNEKYLGPGAYRLFISNRFLRLMPVYWAVLLITVVVALLSPFLFGVPGYTPLASWTVFFGELSLFSKLYLVFTNIFIFGQDVVMFLEINSLDGSLGFISNFRESMPGFPHLWKFLFVPQGWSLALELVFYIIAPFIVTKRASLVLAVAAASIILRLYIYSIGLNSDPWTYRFLPTELALFLLGALSYRLYKFIGGLDLSTALNFVIPALFILLTFFFQLLPKAAWGGIISTNFYFLMLFLSIPFFFRLTKKSRVDSFLGELSYPIYLIHWLVAKLFFDAIFYAVSPRWHQVVEAALIAVVIIAAIGLVFLVERPVEGIRRRRVERAGL